MVNLKGNTSKKRKELFQKLLSIPDQYDDFLIMVLSYTHGEKDEQEIIDFIDSKEAITAIEVGLFVLRKDLDRQGKL